MNVDTTEIFKRLLNVCNIKTLKDFSLHFGYKENWASNCRIKNTIPWDVCLKVAIEKKLSIDYFIFGDGKDSNKIDINELKLSVAEGLFTLIQLDMIKPEKDVKISVLADAITSEITKSELIETSNEIKKAL